MRALNIMVGDTQGQIDPICDPYKDSLDNNLDSNIDNIVVKTIHTKPRPLRQDVSITQPYTPQDVDVLQSSGDFNQASSRRDKHFSALARVKSSLGLPPSIMPPDYSAINTSSISDDWVKRG